MNYNLNIAAESGENQKSTFASLKSLLAHLVDEKKILIQAFLAMLVTASLSLLAPLMIGHAIDKYVQTKQYHGVLVYSAILLTMYIITFGAGYVQTKLMGTVGQDMLFTLRNAVFNKLQELPVDFFNQNKAGDLISRINNDTDKINQFFSQSLMQFVRFILIMIGAGIFLVSINLPLGAAALAPALFIWVFTRFISPWVKRRNAVSMRSVGYLSSAVQESLNNFKVIVAFNRRDYFREKFNESNQENYSNAVSAGLANNLFMPVYGFFSNIGQLVVLTFGIYLISTNEFTIGLLISFLAYITSFYNPLRQLAALWANFQVALAGWDRIARILNLENNMPVIPDKSVTKQSSLISFKNVSFAYPNGSEVLHNISFDLQRGKTYAFVGPTGGGKTTTASLVARLYDPTKGSVLLYGRDIRSYTPEERTRKIGFILQDPFLFTGTVQDNILYGNEEYKDYTRDEFASVLVEAGLDSLIARFESGLDTEVQTSGDGISLGQQQLIAFMRTILRKPDLLILDEATANIDTVTEQLLEEMLEKLPKASTKVIIAHRLNTIENADEIYFVNSGEVIPAGSLRDAVNMLMQGKRVS
ncbi:MAG TPA: ABC transporter ATP-binding protein [Balneolales bacterium]|nr:ABC transporter ATP-binding protein [Balneolales bacterium]